MVTFTWQSSQPCAVLGKARLTRRVIKLLQFLCCLISPKSVVQTHPFFPGGTPQPHEIVHNLYLIIFYPRISFPQETLKIPIFKIREEIKNV